MKKRKLGKVQQAVLQSLQERGFWYSGYGCGWVWDTHSNTKRIMDSLVKRGVAYTAPFTIGTKKIKDGIYYPVNQKEK